MNADHEQDRDDDANDGPPARSSFVPGRFRIILVFGVLAVAAVATLVYLREGVSSGTSKSAQSMTASSVTPVTEKRVSTPALDERRESPRAATSANRPAEAPASASPPSAVATGALATPPAAPTAAAPTVVAQAAKPAAPTVEKESPASSRSGAKESSSAAKESSRPSERREGASTKSEPDAAKPSASKPTAARREPVPREPVARDATGPAGSASEPRGATASGRYWIQVGAFKDSETANRVATRLRDEKLRVELSQARTGGAAPAPSPAPAPAAEPPKDGDRYEVVVSGPSPAEVNAKLSAKGLASQPTADGAVITPSLPLGEAIALSKDLSGESLKVRVRRVGGPAGPRESAETPAARDGATLHRVRVGSFPDRTSAMAALRDLETRGFKPFLVRE